MEVIQVVLHMGAHDGFLQRIGGSRLDYIVIHSACHQLHPFSCSFIDNFCFNDLMINMPERVATDLEEMYLLHDLYEEGEKGGTP